MKRIISLLCILTCTLTLLCGCANLPFGKSNVGKGANTVMTVYTAVNEMMKEKNKADYKLYGIRMLMNSENVGTFTYVYTDKRPDAMSYSDIFVVKVNNRTGNIEKMSAPDFADYGSAPYDMIKTAVPIDPSHFGVDSDTALKTASKAHFATGLTYNYIDANILYKDGLCVYEVKYISLVENLVYISVVDALTGTLISKTVEEL